jgi:hypothetical protein
MSADEDRARWSAVETGESERQTNQLIHSGRGLAQIETFDDHDLFLEKSEMRSMVTGMELLDRQIVDPNELDSAIHEIFRAIGSEERVVFYKLGLMQQRRVPRAE